MSFKKRLTFIFLTFILSLSIIEIAMFSAGKIYLSQSTNVFNFKKSKGEFRILCIGESTTALGLENSYPSLLNKKLNKISSYKFKVINAGAPAITTVQMLKELESYLNLYKPHLVLLMAGINDYNIPNLEKKYFYEHLKTYKMLMALAERIYNKTKISKKVKKEYIWASPSPSYLSFSSEAENLLKHEDVNITQIINSALSNNDFNGHDYLRLVALIEESYPEYVLNSKAIIDQLRLLFLKAIKLGPKNVLFYSSYLGFLNNEYSTFYQEKLGFKERHSDLMKYSLKVLEIDPTLASAHHYIGLLYFDKKMYKTALPYFIKSVELNPYDFHFWWPYIKNLIQLKEFKKALQAAEKAKRINPFENRLITIHKIIKDNIEQENYTFRLPSDINNFISNPNPYAIPQTQKNLSTMATKILEKGILLAFMQYPLRDPKQIESIFDFKKHKLVTVIANQENFSQALKNNEFKYLFWDRFAGDFGHATKQGQLLIVDNIINALDKKWCPEIHQLCLEHNSSQD